MLGYLFAVGSRVGMPFAAVPALRDEVSISRFHLTVPMSCLLIGPDRRRECLACFIAEVRPAGTHEAGGIWWCVAGFDNKRIFRSVICFPLAAGSRSTQVPRYQRCRLGSSYEKYTVLLGTLYP